MKRYFLYIVDPLSGSFATLDRLSTRLLANGRSLSRNLGQVSNADQVVDGGSELEDPTHQPHSAVSGFTQQPHGLQPTEDFFHSFALALTNFITRVASGPLVDRASASLVVLGHMRRYLTGAQICDKVFRVVTLVTGQGDPFLWRPLSQYQQRRFSFRRATGTSQQRIHHQAVAILHQHVALISQFRFAALGLLKESEIGVSTRFVRLIRTFLPMEVYRRIARVIRLVVVAALRLILRLKTFQAGPPFDHRAVHREMFVRQELFGARQLQHCREELFRDFPSQQSVAVLAERGCIPNLVVHVQADEPAEQHVVLQLLHQHPFAAHRVEHLQQQRAQQPLRRDRRAPDSRIQLVKARRQLLEDFIGHLTHWAQGMIRRHSFLWRNVTVHACLQFVVSPHSVPPSLALDQIIVDRDLFEGKMFSFSAACYKKKNETRNNY